MQPLTTPLTRPQPRSGAAGFAAQTPDLPETSTRLSRYDGVWVPLITPFRDGDIDLVSWRRMLHHYAAQPLDGLIIAATTGESLTLSDTELETLVFTAREILAARQSTARLFVGLSGSDTRQLVSAMGATAGWPIDGYLIVCPYYVRPSQAGLYAHFMAAATATDRPILLYNIPYRTGVNLANDTLLALADCPTIVGIKDCCADAAQTRDLIACRPAGFAVLTGEDAHYYNVVQQGGDGGVLAAAHIDAALLQDVRRRLSAHERGSDDGDVLAIWQRFSALPPLLFAEPNPAPIKYWLWRDRLIDSPELRLPMTPVSPALAARLDAAHRQYRQD